MSEVTLLCVGLSATSMHHSGSAPASSFGSPRNTGRKDKKSIVLYFFSRKFPVYANSSPPLFGPGSYQFSGINQALPPSQPENFTWAVTWSTQFKNWQVNHHPTEII